MSMDLNFWKYKKGAAHDDSKVYESACCDGNILEGLESLPIYEIIEKVASAFSDWTALDQKHYEKNGSGAFEIFTTPQIVRFNCYGMQESDMNSLMDILIGFGCPLQAQKYVIIADKPMKPGGPAICQIRNGRTDMDRNIEKIWIEIYSSQEPVNYSDCNSDVHFELTDGSKWVATFFTYKNIETLRRKNQLTGECLNGTYFCATDMILISEMSEAAIKSVLREMLSQGEIETYCHCLCRDKNGNVSSEPGGFHNEY